MSRIVLEDFNGGNGCYKVNLAELNKEQVEEIENLVKKWNPELEESDDERIRKGLLYVIEHHPALPTEEAEEYIAWLEKQGEQKPTHKVKPKFKVGDIIRHKEQRFTCKIIAVDTEYILSGCSGNHLPFDSQDAYELVEQKFADKVEPKFHEGEWVVNKFGDVWHIDSFDKKNYQVSNGNEYNYFPISKQNEMHLWTIEDVKDGDVLAVTMYIGGTWIGIFKEQNGCTFSSHCYVNTEGIFKQGTYGHGNGRTIHPASKEQCDFLFKKMHEEGYEWDSEKKELKKIDQKPAWSEESAKAINRISEILVNASEVKNWWKEYRLIERDEMIRLTDFLKSLRPQSTWKPSDMELEVLRLAAEKDGTCLMGLYEQLKKLKEE